MAHGDFVWCDLSARRLDDACAFYNRLFGWQFLRETAPDGSEYRMAFSESPIAGLYAMPQKFDDMGMPCFWMSYIEVTSVRSTIDTAKDHGAKIEVGPIDGANGSTIALIRDPLGAGFTVIEGEGLVARSDNPKHGDMAWNELYVSDASAVIPFYKAVFDWEIAPTAGARNSFSVTINGVERSAIHQLRDNVRGQEQFWGVHFAVRDLAAARAIVLESGSRLFESDTTILARDPDDGAFFLQRINSER